MRELVVRAEHLVWALVVEAAAGVAGAGAGAGNTINGLGEKTNGKKKPLSCLLYLYGLDRDGVLSCSG